MENPAENEKRVRRMKLSKVLHFSCKGLVSPCIKWAETFDELKQAFSLVHDTYLDLGYLRKAHKSGMHYSIHNFLADTATLVVKSDSTVVATLTQVADTEKHGLPMDQLFKSELDELRRKGRNIAELCSLVTLRKLCGKNLFMQLSRIMYTHAFCNGIDDFCIMVNPKHVAFYKLIFLFEQLGPEKFYPALGVPAIALRADLRESETKLKKAYEALDYDSNLYAYMHNPLGAYHLPWEHDLLPPKEVPPEISAYFGIQPDSEPHMRGDFPAVAG